MEIDFNNLEDIEIDKEGLTKKKLNKYIMIIPIFSIIFTILVVIISFYYLIKGDYKKQKKEEGEKDKKVIINCIEGEDDLCSTCENDECVSCNYRYDLINGSCIPTFSIKVIYETTKFNESIEIINSHYIHNVLEIEIDKEPINIDDARKNYFNFIMEYPGNHTIYLNFNTFSQTRFLTSIFSSEEKIVYIHFTKEFKTENITQIQTLFLDHKNVKYIDISNFDMKNMKQFESIFLGCTSLTSVKLPNSIAPNLKSLKYLFSNCESLTFVNFSKAMNYSAENLSELEEMFSGCVSLKSIDFSNLKTNVLSNTKNMFNNCTSLTSLDLSNFKTNQLKMDNMFLNCKNLSYIDISNFGIPLSYNNCITNFPSKGKIRMNKNISNIIKKFVPKTWDFDII